MTDVLATLDTEPQPEPATSGLRPAVQRMLAELDAHYKGANPPSIDKATEAVQPTSANPKSWDSRGQVAEAVNAYRERYGLTANRPAAKKPKARTSPAKRARTAPVQTAPVPSTPTVVHGPARTVEQPQPVPTTKPPVRRVVIWPLVLLAQPAFVAVWSGWVGLGGLTGFGVVHPLPGIADSFSLNTAITLPIGVETYGSYALYVWLSGRVPARAKTFAMWSAIASLAVGALGQVAYHLLVEAGVDSAPWWITTAVSILPVAVLGMGAALAHLVREEA